MTSWTMTQDGALAVLTFDRPPRNFMSFKALGDLSELLQDIASREDITAVLLTSSRPGYFVAHADLDDLAKVTRGEPYEGERTAWRTTPSLLESMPQPVIAAIDGQAWGGGTEIALACALRIASASSTFSLPEIKMAQAPAAGAAQRLPRIIGLGRAMDLLLTGRKLDATEALQMGLINAVLPDDDFRAAAVAYAQRVASLDRETLVRDKRLVQDGVDLTLDEGLALAREATIALTGRPESLARREALAERYATTPPEVTVDF